MKERNNNSKFIHLVPGASTLPIEQEEVFYHLPKGALRCNTFALGEAIAWMKKHYGKEGFDLFVVPHFHYYPQGILLTLDEFLRMTVAWRAAEDDLENELQIYLPDDPMDIIYNHYEGGWIHNFEAFNIFDMGLSPKTHVNPILTKLPKYKDGYIVRGFYSSAKNMRLMYAKDSESLIELLRSEFFPNREISKYGTVIRERVKIASAGEYNGESHTKEYRFIFYDDVLLTSGFYHAHCSSDYAKNLLVNDIPKSAIDLAQIGNTAMRLADRPLKWNTVDVAILEDGTATIIEVNYGGSSGLPLGTDPAVYFQKLQEAMILSVFKS